MRTREKVDERLDELAKQGEYKPFVNLQIELLLDIRDLLEKIQTDMPTWEQMPE
jgi:hypothetical protein